MSDGSSRLTKAQGVIGVEGTDPMPVKEAFSFDRFKCESMVFPSSWVSTYLVLEAEEPGVCVDEGLVWPTLNTLSAITLSWPGMCMALRITRFLEHQVMILHSRAHKGLHASFLLYISNNCGVVCGYKHYLVQVEVLELF